VIIVVELGIDDIQIEENLYFKREKWDFLGKKSPLYTSSTNPLIIMRKKKRKKCKA